MFSSYDHRMPRVRFNNMNQGDLVRIGSVFCENKQKIGIIIECIWGFGISSTQEWFVLVDGKIRRYEDKRLWVISDECIR